MASQLLKNDQKTLLICSMIKEVCISFISTHGKANLENGCEGSVGNLIRKFADNYKLTPFFELHRKTVVQYIAAGKINSVPQVEASVQYLKSNAEFNADAFEAFCGVGVEVTEEQIDHAIAQRIGEIKSKLVQDRYTYPIARQILGHVREQLKWADGKVLKEKVDDAILQLLGPKTDTDTEMAKSKKKTTGPAKNRAVAPVDEKPEEAIEYIEKTFSGRDIPAAHNPPELIAEHKKVTNGKLRTRFPPEPNGFLHIGHAKAMNFNFGVAKRAEGECILRFDDTNPSAEKQVYIDSIIDTCQWLGHSPSRITYSSDYFDQLYDYAVQLIKGGNAYVCHQTKEEIRECRKEKSNQKPSPYRNRPIEENLRLFSDMRRGRFDEGEATLRMKIDITSPNPCMWDPVAYRIKYEPHPHVGDKWCIYPSYDFTHCLVDSIEHIDYSLCTLEFEIRRDSYYWLLQVLNVYRPMVWEYSRLNITHGVMSKRKLKYLVDNKYVLGWDDPRLFTLSGLRRRGFTPAAINDMCAKVGVSRTTTGFVKLGLLEACVRGDLDEKAPRVMVVLEPLKLRIQNWDADHVEQISVANFPKDPSRGAHKVYLSNIVYIDRSDFRLEDSKKYFGLAPGKTVHLKYAYNITCEQVIQSDDGSIEEIFVTVDKENKKKVKGNLHWVSGKNPINITARILDVLFKSEFPGKKEVVEGEEIALVEEEDDDPNKWLQDVNPDSCIVKSNALMDEMMTIQIPQDLSICHFQFEREGFFVMDSDSTVDKLVFNRTVALKSSFE